MLKNFKFKIFSSMIIFSIIFIISLNYNVKATTNDEVVTLTEEELNVITEELGEEKILCYDATTGETTEVDTDALIEALLEESANEGILATESNLPGMNVYDSKLLSTSRATYTASRVTDTTTFPARVICRTISDKSQGSGVLVASNLCLTAAHCIWSSDDNSKATNWVCQPGYNSGLLNSMSSGWSKVYYSSYWMDTHSVQYDWAICVLESSLGSNYLRMCCLWLLFITR